MQKSNYEVEVLVKGKPIKEYQHKSKIYVEGRQGTSFSLRFRNNSGSRKLFVPSIDGLSIMNGEECNFNSSGYIIKPYSALTIDGWRKNDEEVAEFYFSSPNDSYRKRMEKGNNLGVIGVVVFSEKELPVVIKEKEYIPYPYPVYPPRYPSCPQTPIYPFWGTTYTHNEVTAYTSNAVSCAADGNYCAQQTSQNLGTGWGETKKSEVTTVNFERKDSPEEVFEIYYNTREQLEKMGVNLKKEPIYVAPQAFPGQYCKPPAR